MLASKNLVNGGIHIAGNALEKIAWHHQCAVSSAQRYWIHQIQTKESAFVVGYR
jgi:hypothetical protein